MTPLIIILWLEFDLILFRACKRATQAGQKREAFTIGILLGLWIFMTGAYPIMIIVSILCQFRPVFSCRL